MGNQIKSDGLHTTTGSIFWQPVPTNMMNTENNKNNCFEFFIEAKF